MGEGRVEARSRFAIQGMVLSEKEEVAEPGKEEEDKSDAETLYSILEQQVVPLYYNRDRGGVPREWIAMVKRSIQSIIPVFNTRRMLKEYCEKMYLPAIQGMTVAERSDKIDPQT